MKETDNMVVEPLTGNVEAFKEPLPVVTDNYEVAPLLTLRELMPGSAAGDDDDPELDQTFRANKVEFMVVQRDLTPAEKTQDAVLQDPSDVDWTIPEQEEYEDIMGSDERPELVHALCWSSVGSSTGVGCFSIRTGRLDNMEDIRGTLRSILVNDKCFESFPKRALMKSYSLTAFFPRSTK